MYRDTAFGEPEKFNNHLFSLLLIALPVAVWWGYLLNYSVNVPWFDDLDPFSDFIRQWSSDPGLSAKASLLFRPNNEHRMVFGKLAALFYYQLTGTLDIRFLHVAGGFFMCGTAVICWRVFRLLGLAPAYFIPVTWLLFQVKTHLVFLWAVCSLQHQPVIFFVCLSLYLLAKGRFGWAVVTAFCATFSMSNGMLVWVAGMAVLLYRTEWKGLLIWTVAAVGGILLYFHGMTTQGNEASISYFLAHPHLSVLGFFTFLGGLFDIFPINQPVELRSLLPCFGGMFLSGWGIWWLWRLYSPWVKVQWRSVSGKNPAHRRGTADPVRDFVIGVLVFSLLNGLLVGFLRPRFGFFVFLLSNYKLYTFIFAVVIYLAFLAEAGKAARRRYVVAIISGAVGCLIWILSVWVETPVINERRKFLLVNAYNQEHNGYGLGFSPDNPAAAFLDTLMKDLSGAGIYRYPATYRLFFDLMRIPSGYEMIPAEGIAVSKGDSAIFVVQDQVRIGPDRDAGSYAYAVNNHALYIFQMSQISYTGRNPFRQYENIRSVEIPYHFLAPGDYRIGLMHISGGVVRKHLVDSLSVAP